MATLKELRIRLVSLKNTKKITSAMKMVSASKLRKAKDSSLHIKMYMEKMQGVINRVLCSGEFLQNPLLKSRPVKKKRTIILASDRGLCGGFNNNLIKFFLNQNLTGQNNQVEVIGKKAYDALKKLDRWQIVYHDHLASAPKYDGARLIIEKAIADFLNEEIDELDIIYNQFISTLIQKPTKVQLLPIIPNNENQNESIGGVYLFEPNPQKLLEEILPKQVSTLLFKAMIDNSAGEHASRMTAMDNATNNAKELISSLTIQLNRARQASITTELTEIVSGAESLKN